MLILVLVLVRARGLMAGVFTQSLVLENLADAFAKPCILDIKLGTVLYDDEAAPEKKARMEKTARETTSFETGVRLTGFQVISFHAVIIGGAQYFALYRSTITLRASPW